MTKVSVLMPVYNTNPLYLKTAVESVLQQTLTDFELLILNDSPDNRELKNIIASYNDSRIIYMENARNIGISASRNKLLKAASAQYIAIMDHDDISLPGRLEKQALYLDASPDTGVVGCNIRKIGTNIVSDFPIDNKSVKSALPDGCVIAHTAAMIRKSVLTDNDISWEADFSPCEDYMLWGRLAGKTLFHNLPEILVEYRSVFLSILSYTRFTRAFLKKSLFFLFIFYNRVSLVCLRKTEGYLNILFKEGKKVCQYDIRRGSYICEQRCCGKAKRKYCRLCRGKCHSDRKMAFV